MGDQTRDRVGGRAKAAWGELTGNEDLQAEGQTDQAKGGLKQGVADVKDKVDEAVKEVIGSDDDSR